MNYSKKSLNNDKNMCKKISESMNFKCAALPMKLSIFLKKNRFFSFLFYHKVLLLAYIEIRVNSVNFTRFQVLEDILSHFLPLPPFWLLLGLLALLDPRGLVRNVFILIRTYHSHIFEPT